MSSDKITKSSLRESIESIGKYYGVRSKSAFIDLLIDLENNQNIDEQKLLELLEKHPSHELGELFLQASEGSLGIKDILEHVNKKLTPTKETATSTQNFEKMIPGIMQVLFEPGAFKDKLAPLALKFQKGERGVSSPAYDIDPEKHPPELKFPGSQSQSDCPADLYPDRTGSVRRMMWSAEVEKAMREKDSSNKGKPQPFEENILLLNKNISADPSKENPHVSCILIKDPMLSPATHDTSAFAVFTAFLPSIEISRALPFLNISVISSRQPINPGTSRIDSMSLGQFLLGNETISKTSQGFITLSAVDDNLLRDPQFFKKDKNNQPQLNSFSTAGMELFTSPQMLVPADETWTDPDVLSKDANSSSDTSISKRSANVIDRFRPLASITSFSVSVLPMGAGLISSKTAELAITLHDRSRIAEIGELIKPDMYGNLELLIEYGWMHPDAINLANDSEEQAKFSKFLNSMRIKEKYKIYNSSFSFDDSGQVTIKISLQTPGLIAFDNNDISKGPGVEDELKKVRELINIVKEIRRRTEPTDRDEAADVSGETWLSSINSPASISNLDEETKKAMDAWRQKNRTKNNNSNANTDQPSKAKAGEKNKNSNSTSTSQELASALDRLLGPVNAPGGVFNQLRQTIQQALAGKDELLKNVNAGDPFWCPVYKNSGNYCNVKYHVSDTAASKSRAGSKSYVSLGKLFMTYAIPPLVVDGGFDEIQVFFYTFNEDASFMHDKNIAEFPIEYEEFKRVLQKMTQATAYIPVKQFLETLNSNFISKDYNQAYGMSGLYELGDSKDGKEKVMVLKGTYKDNPTALHDERQKVLSWAYTHSGLDENKPQKFTFRKPRLGIFTETVASMNAGVDGPEKPANNFTILKIHIYDRSSTPYSSLHDLLKAARNNSLAQIGKITRKPHTATAKEISESEKNRIEYIQKLTDAKIIEPMPESPDTYRVIGGFRGIKRFIKSTMPSITYGAQNSALISASVTSMNDSELATIYMQRSFKEESSASTPFGARSVGLPLRVTPVEANIEMFGCPIAQHGQQVFIDFGTGTSIDNIYYISEISHDISQGEFKTKLKLKQLDAYGVYESALDTINQTVAQFKDK